MMPSMKLVSLDQVTHRAVMTGDWTNPATWENGQVPSAGARVHIPVGLKVTVDGIVASEIKTVRLDGTLDFATNVNTELKVDTLVSTKSGHLIVGTAANPIDADVTAKITIADDGAIDKTWDPSLVSRGALLHGKTTMNGAEKTGFVAVQDYPMKGDTSLTLKSAPTGWKVGDEIVIASTDPKTPTQDDKVTITAIDGTTISFDRPLTYDHAAPRADLEVHVANLTRNVEIASENTATAHRGHVMVMQTNDVDIRNVAFEDLGRSDKSVPYNDLEFVDLHPTNAPTDLGGDNVRGRYAFHVHKGGTAPGSDAAHVSGSVVDGSPGWGFVNHSSNVDFVGNVSYDVTGAAYYTEAGDEIGSFKGNIALRTVNPNDPLMSQDDVDPDAREERQDYGFQGDGFWFHGPNVQVEGNVVAGASGHAYIWWPEGLLEKSADGSTQKVFHNAANVPNGNLIGSDPRMQIMDVPIGSFKDNAGYGTTKGIQIYYLHTEFFGDGLYTEDGTTPPPLAYDNQLRSTISDSTIWNVEQSAVAAPYANKVTFENLTLVNGTSKGTVGLDLAHFQNENGLEVKNVKIDGFDVGLKLTTQGQVTVTGGEIKNSGTELQYITPDEDGGGRIVSQGDFVSTPGTVSTGDDDDNVVSGGAGDDKIGALSGTNSFDGGSGNDLIVGGCGDDMLSGGSDNDVIKGDVGSFLFGNDQINGGNGDDLLMGGGGADVFVFAAGDGNDTIGELTIDFAVLANSSITGPEFESGVDRIDVSAMGFGSAAAALANVSDIEGVATFNAQGTTIVFTGLVTADLSLDDFIFV